jgi:hypothetical protein
MRRECEKEEKNWAKKTGSSLKSTFIDCEAKKR